MTWNKGQSQLELAEELAAAVNAVVEACARKDAWIAELERENFALHSENALLRAWLVGEAPKAGLTRPQPVHATMTMESDPPPSDGGDEPPSAPEAA